MDRRRWLFCALGSLFTACVHQPVLRVRPARARIRLLPVDVRDPDPDLRAAVERALPDALILHGFFLTNDGAPVHVEVSIGPGESASDGTDPMGAHPATSYLDYTARLSASPRTLVAQATGVGESMGSNGAAPGSPGAGIWALREARRAAVIDGAERLARAMVDVLGSAPWS